MKKEQLQAIINCIEAIAEETFMAFDSRDTTYHDSTDYKKALFVAFGYTKQDYYDSTSH